MDMVTNVKYVCHNIKVMNSTTNLKKFHIIVDPSKWSEFIGDRDMRFFKHTKTLLQNLNDSPNGHMIKLSSWDSQLLKKCYYLSKKYRHPNLLRYECYFEYECDIINYLLDGVESEQFEESAVIITPYFMPITEAFQDMDESAILLCIKQIVLVLYTMLYNNKLFFKNINVNNIYVSVNLTTPVTIKYESPSVNKVKTNYIVKIDEYSNAIRVDYISNVYSENLRLLIVAILRQFKLDYTQMIADMILRCNNNADDIIKEISDCQ